MSRYSEWTPGPPDLSKPGLYLIETLYLGSMIRERAVVTDEGDVGIAVVAGPRERKRLVANARWHIGPIPDPPSPPSSP
jgi:hypothetical protein